MTVDRPTIENAYAVFAPYRVGHDLDYGARVGASDSEFAHLRRTLAETPLRALSFDAVAAYIEYIDAAHYDGGFRADELRYFLPRTLELLATDAKRAEARDLAEMLKRILARANARAAWPTAEIDAIDRVLRTGG